jgi:undecaprenyl-diphosphatase
VTVFQAIVLGILQGLAEWLPISSTAHLRVVPALLNWGDPGAAFTAVTQLGTAAAVVLYFQRDLRQVAGSWLVSLVRPERRKEQEARMGWYLLAATIPVGVIGFALRDQIEQGARDLVLIAGALIGVGGVMLVAELVGRQDRALSEVGWRDALAVGFAQAAALVPGVSRSGATISTGLFLGLERTAAARFSFLLSVPAIVAAGLFELYRIGTGEVEGGDPLALVVATLTAFATGYAAIAFLLRYLANHTQAVFIAYRVALGLLVLWLATSGRIS